MIINSDVLENQTYHFERMFCCFVHTGELVQVFLGKVLNGRELRQLTIMALLYLLDDDLF